MKAATLEQPACLAFARPSIRSVSDVKSGGVFTCTIKSTRLHLFQSFWPRASLQHLAGHSLEAGLGCGRYKP
jgi:hypothetical protein